MNDKFWVVLAGIKPEIEAVHQKILSTENKNFKGTQVFFSPYVENPKYLFIGINPGAGYFRDNKVPVKRFLPIEHFEYLHYNYQLARETRIVFKAAGILEDLKRSMKINYFSFATDDQRALEKLLNSMKAEKLWYKSKLWTEKLISAINPGFIICEGRQIFQKLVEGRTITAFADGVYIAHVDGRKIIGYSRYRSLIRNKEGLIDLLIQLDQETSECVSVEKTESEII